MQFKCQLRPQIQIDILNFFSFISHAFFIWPCEVSCDNRWFSLQSLSCSMRRTQLTTTDSRGRFKMIKKITSLVRRQEFSMWPHLLVRCRRLISYILSFYSNFTEVKVVPMFAVSFTLVYWTYAIYCYGQDEQP